jgi:uncharacterized protein YfkK (UPF0435 family)
MKGRREAVQHVKLNILNKGILKGQSKEAHNSTREQSTYKMSKTSEEVSEEGSQGSASEEGQYSRIESVEVSQFTYGKLVLLEKHLFFVLLWQLFWGLVLAEVENRAEMEHEEDVLLVIMSLINLLLGMPRSI